MITNAERFFALVYVALAFGPSAAHLLESPNKIGLPRDEYLTVQHLYNGWALLGIVVVGALVATLVLALRVRRKPRQFAYAVAAFSCVAATQVVFCAFTFPFNRATRNWTELPEPWQALRAQWEYSHAVGALLNFAALVLLVLCLLAAVRENPAQRE
jgi:hypothetical protein